MPAESNNSIILELPHSPLPYGERGWVRGKRDSMYQERVYRDYTQAKSLIKFTVKYKETDLEVQAKSDLSEIGLSIVQDLREDLEKYIARHPEFLKSFVPINPLDNPPFIASLMIECSRVAGVGPMAAVAGAFAEIVGNELMKYSPEVIIENGGDIFIGTTEVRIVDIFAGNSPFTHRIGIKVKPDLSPYGICTSSGTVGHSFSFGKADATCILSKSAALADAAATAVANVIQTKEDLENALNLAKSMKGILGAVLIKDDKLGAWGEIELVKT